MLSRREPARRVLEAMLPYWRQAYGNASSLHSLGREAKLPLIDLALPALRHLGPDDYRRFAQLVQELIEYDSAIDLFEYTLQKISAGT